MIIAVYCKAIYVKPLITVYSWLHIINLFAHIYIYINTSQCHRQVFLVLKISDVAHLVNIVTVSGLVCWQSSQKHSPCYSAQQNMVNVFALLLLLCLLLCNVLVIHW